MSRKELSMNIRSTFNYLQIFNGLTGLTDTEMKVLAEFIDMKKNLEKAGLDTNPFSTEMRKQVAKNLGRDDYTTLNNYIKRIHDKGAITRVEDGYKIQEILIPSDGEKEVVFYLNYNGSN